MTKRSTLLKVVSILMIIFSAIALFTVIGAIGAINMIGGIEMVASLGIDPGVYQMALIISIVACIAELLIGILGLVCKSQKVLVMLGLILIIIQLVSLILSIVSGSFAWTSLISFVLPILYFLGAKQCIQ